MKKKIPAIAISFMLICISLLFCACSNVNLVNYTDDDGSYNEVVEITLDETQFTNPSKVKQDITSHVKTTLLDLCANYELKIKAEIAKYKYDKDNQELYNSYLDLLDDVSYKIQEFEDDNYFFVKTTFKSESSYLMFYDIKEKALSSKETKKGFFYDTYYYKGTVGYALQTGLYSSLNQSPYLKKYFEDYGIDNAELTYTYLAPSSRYKSNADSVNYLEDGKYAHSWKVNEQTLNRNIYFKLRIAHRQVWFILAIVISLLSIIVITIIALIKTHKSKKNTEKEAD